MGEIQRKRGRYLVERVDEEIHFVKRPRLNSVGSSDSNGSSSDERSWVSDQTARVATRKTRKTILDDSEASRDSEITFNMRRPRGGKTEVVLRRRPEERSEKGNQAGRTKAEGERGGRPVPVLVPVPMPVVMAEEAKETAIKLDEKREAEECGEDTREMNRRSPNGFLLPDPLPRGEVLHDKSQQEWTLGKAIGVGGFGELYLASLRKPDGTNSPEQFVVKVEPHTNGPLFVEVHFYLRATRVEQLEEFRKEKGLDHLGVPRYIASGSHVKRGQRYRFLVMERFGSDLQRIIENSEGGRLTDKTVCEVTLQVLNSLEYIHSRGYVHKDVKASNLLVGMGMQGQHLVHLVDFGLVSKYRVGGLHKLYTHDLRWAHEGTMEYTSRDAHIGSASRRGDLEVLVYNLIEWWGGVLPWDRDFSSPESTKTAKFRAFASPQKFLRHCFRDTSGSSSSNYLYSPLLLKLMKYVAGLRFEQEPDYDLVRGYVKQEMQRLGLVQDGLLEFRLARGQDAAAPPNGNRSASNAFLLPPLSEGERVSAIFDRMCVSVSSWERAKETELQRRNQDSLQNPTQAMLDIMERMKSRGQAKDKASGGKKKRHKSTSSYLEDASPNTPAMLAVMNLAKLRQYDEEAVEARETDMVTRDARAAVLLPCRVLAVPIIPPHVVDGLKPLSVRWPTPRADCPTTPKTAARSRAKELARLDPFLASPKQSDDSPGRRTRSADVLSQEESRSLRSTFRFGFGNMRNIMRQVSDSFTNIF